MGLPFDAKQVQPQFLMSSETAMERVRYRDKVVFRAIANPTNQRSMIATVISEFPGGHMLPAIYVNKGDLNSSVCLSALLNSFLFDRLLRLKMGSPAIGFFILDEWLCQTARFPPHSSDASVIWLHVLLLSIAVSPQSG